MGLAILVAAVGFTGELFGPAAGEARARSAKLAGQATSWWRMKSRTRG